jgi:hypothetical protein
MKTVMPIKLKIQELAKKFGSHIVTYTVEAKVIAFFEDSLCYTASYQ